MSDQHLAGSLTVGDLLKDIYHNNDLFHNDLLPSSLRDGGGILTLGEDHHDESTHDASGGYEGDLARINHTIRVDAVLAKLQVGNVIAQTQYVIHSVV